MDYCRLHREGRVRCWPPETVMNVAVYRRRGRGAMVRTASRSSHPRVISEHPHDASETALSMTGRRSLVNRSHPVHLCLKRLLGVEHSTVLATRARSVGRGEMAEPVPVGRSQARLASVLLLSGRGRASDGPARRSTRKAAEAVVHTQGRVMPPGYAGFASAEARW